jgi:hypothetical protein
MQHMLDYHFKAKYLIIIPFIIKIIIIIILVWGLVILSSKKNIWSTNTTIDHKLPRTPQCPHPMNARRQMRNTDYQCLKDVHCEGGKKVMPTANMNLGTSCNICGRCFCAYNNCTCLS